MSKLRFPPASESKLSKTIAKISQDEVIEKTGFIGTKNNKTTYFKTKSFRLRELDFANLSFIAKEVNNKSERKTYSESEIIRGIINYISDNLETNAKKVLTYIKNSS